RHQAAENIFLMRSGQVKLGDFGVAKTLDCTLQLASTAIGTPDRPTVQALLKKEVLLLPALLKHISAEAPALRFSASFRLAFQEVAAIQQASPASAGQKRPGSAPRPSSASSKRAWPAAAAAYPAAPLSPYAQKLGGGGGGGNESASLAAARRRDQEQRLAAVRRANEQHRQRMQQQQQKEREQDEAKTPPAARRSTGRVSRRSPQQQQLHPGVAVPSSSPSASPTPPPAADNQSERAQRLLEDYWERKRLAARIKAQGGLGGLGAPRRPLIRFHLAQRCRSCGEDLTSAASRRSAVATNASDSSSAKMFNRSVTFVKQKSTP
uniref:non-specific serine/threonine protein kinase n=1 Tax=Macrostomum lignano TaxID=282301 RepID=A0A1I8FHL9_9PLAT